MYGEIPASLLNPLPVLVPVLPLSTKSSRGMHRAWSSCLSSTAVFIHGEICKYMYRTLRICVYITDRLLEPLGVYTMLHLRPSEDASIEVSVRPKTMDIASHARRGSGTGKCLLYQWYGSWWQQEERLAAAVKSMMHVHPLFDVLRPSIFAWAH